MQNSYWFCTLSCNLWFDYFVETESQTSREQRAGRNLLATEQKLCAEKAVADPNSDQIDRMDII